MKQTLSTVLIALLLLSLCLTACSEEAKPETFTCGDYDYILLDDGTAEIVKYHNGGYVNKIMFSPIILT